MPEPLPLSFEALHQSIAAGKQTCAGIVDHYLQGIKQSDLNAFLEVYDEEAQQHARVIDEKIRSGKAGKLAGMVVGLKDNICYKGHRVSASSRILEGFESLYSATAVQRLLEEDAIIIGRLNCDEFAMGSSNENSAYGPVKHPVNKKHVPGGSSGGSSAAVRAGLCTVALGSDTGGSVRQPASLCGVVGLKPTYGRVSRHGLLAFASSFDQIGVLANTLADAGLVLEVIAGHDDYDSTAARRAVATYSKATAFQGKARIACLADCLTHDHLDADIRDGVKRVASQLRKAGHTVEDVRFPYLDYLVPAYYVLTTAEASSNLARYDGVHYGYRSADTETMDEVYERSRTERFGPEVKRRIMLGTFVLSAGYYDAYYAKAQQARRIIRDATKKILDQYDFILLPTSPVTAPKRGEQVKDPVTMYLSDIFTVQANLAGIPAVSLPVGEDKHGLPYGVQLMGPPFEEKAMLAFGLLLVEQCTVTV